MEFNPKQSGEKPFSRINFTSPNSPEANIPATRELIRA